MFKLMAVFPSNGFASLIRRCQLFQSRKVQPGVLAAIVLRPAHLRLRLQLRAHGGPLGPTKNQTPQIGPQLDTAHASGLAQRHAGYG
jgi:hypothetical protein